MRVPSGEKVIAYTGPLCPVRVVRGVPVVVSQVGAVRSSDAVARRAPWGENVTGCTGRMCDRVHGAVVSGEGGAWCAGGGVPGACGAVAGCGGDEGAVGGECDART